MSDSDVWDGDESDPEYQAALVQARRDLRPAVFAALLGWALTVLGVVLIVLAVVDASHAGNMLVIGLLVTILGAVLVVGNRTRR